MPTINFRVLLVSVVALLALSACSPDTQDKNSAAAATGAVLATVNGVPITARRVDAIVSQGASAGRPDTPEARKSIVDGLTMQIIVAEEAIRKGLDKTPEVAEQIDSMRQSVLAEAYVQDYIKTNATTDDMLKAEYERIKGTISGSEYKARHILVADEAEAKDIIAKLKKDLSSFSKMAMEKSTDPGSKSNGGDLGWFDLDRMVPEFKDAVAKMEKGSFTQEPVKTEFGYHVILLEDIRPIEAPAFDEVKPDLARQLQQQNLLKHFETLKAAAKIEPVAVPDAAPSASVAAPEQAVASPQAIAPAEGQ